MRCRIIVRARPAHKVEWPGPSLYAESFLFAAFRAESLLRLRRLPCGKPLAFRRDYKIVEASPPGGGAANPETFTSESQRLSAREAAEPRQDSVVRII